MPGVVTATILGESGTVSDRFPPRHIEVSREVNRIPSAEISLPDGNIAEREFAGSQFADFAPGKELEIKLRYEGDPASEKTVFKGMIVSQTVGASERDFHLTLELRDKAFKMTTARRSAVYREKKDSDIFQTLIQAHGLQAGTIESTQTTHPELVQYDCSDWDFLLLRAEANGLLVVVNDGEVSVVKPQIGGAAQRLEFGMSPIYSLEMRADATQQLGEVGASAWDIENQDLLAPESGTAPAASLGDLDPADLAQKVGADDIKLASPGWRKSQEMRAWADAQLLRSRLALHRGVISVEGSGSHELLQTIEILSISAKFDGTTLITGLRHEVTPGSWVSDLQFGLDPAPHARTFQDVASLPAKGLLPSIGGLHVGVVEGFEDDPGHQFRVKVRVPTLLADDKVLWARQIRPDAGNERGIVFYPEIGDEVVLGFLDDDPREPVVLGSLHSSAQVLPPPIGSLTEDNFLKGIFTREGLHLLFDDEKKTLTLQTSDNQKITLNTQDKTIEIADDNNNKITMSDKGIEFKSAKDIKIEASGKVEIKGSTVDVK